MSFGIRRHRGIAAVAALATLVSGTFPVSTQASSGDPATLALQLFNTQRCAQHYVDNSTVAQATPPPATPAPTPSPIVT
ncbi:MAG: hypothetical protein WCB99_09950, partial [Candidatus Cybelea sp.]